MQSFFLPADIDTDRLLWQLHVEEKPNGASDPWSDRHSDACLTAGGTGRRRSRLRNILEIRAPFRVYSGPSSLCCSRPDSTSRSVTIMPLSGGRTCTRTHRHDMHDAFSVCESSGSVTPSECPSDRRHDRPSASSSPLAFSCAGHRPGWPSRPTSTCWTVAGLEPGLSITESPGFPMRRIGDPMRPALQPSPWPVRVERTTGRVDFSSGREAGAKTAKSTGDQ
ncbi:unnamed protein product [Protopolystoma xenopodis]|uniref:Uncharacterized protein n=1 Tax=Protopolystoma xenopodis TaxID=117903 RepID=A0A3S5B9Z1_9PLAT|nr:unnamed protein product [Protopolystoma xenopodis]